MAVAKLCAAADPQAMAVRHMYFPPVLGVHKVVSARHSPRASTFLERLDLRMSVTTGAYSEKLYFGRDEAQRCPKHTLELGSHVGNVGGCHKPRK